MKRIFILLLMLIFSPVCFADDTSVLVTIPEYDISINGQSVDTYHSQYPVLNYKNITYFPMTSDYLKAIGLKIKFSKNEGLNINHGGTIKPLEEKFLGADNELSSEQTALIAPFDIHVNGMEIDNSNEIYPILLYKNITYFPMTWRFCVTEFNWSTSFSQKNGFSISCGDAVDQKSDNEVQHNILNNDLITWVADNDIVVTDEIKLKIEAKLLPFIDWSLREKMGSNIELKPFIIHIIEGEYIGFASMEDDVSSINITSDYFKVFNNTSNYYVIYHEMIHVMDMQQLEFETRSIREGLADYMSMRQRRLDTGEDINLHMDSEYSDEILNDFKSYMIECENTDDQNAPYRAGYHFFDYLVQTYGDGIISKYMDQYKSLMVQTGTFEAYEKNRESSYRSFELVTNEHVFEDFAKWFRIQNK